MIEPALLEWIGVMGVAVVVFLAGRASGLRSKRLPRIRYDCSTCGHGIGYHRDKKGRCEHVSAFDETQCKCQQYIGDRPPPTYEELTR